MPFQNNRQPGKKPFNKSPKSSTQRTPQKILRQEEKDLSNKKLEAETELKQAVHNYISAYNCDPNLYHSILITFHHNLILLKDIPSHKDDNPVEDYHNVP